MGEKEGKAFSERKSREKIPYKGISSRLASGFSPAAEVLEVNGAKSFKFVEEMIFISVFYTPFNYY